MISINGMTNLLGEPYEEPKKKRTEMQKKRRRWEDAFQRWCDKESADGHSPDGCCGCGSICDMCDDSSVGRPCVRALNELARKKKVNIDYDDYNGDSFRRWFYL